MEIARCGCWLHQRRFELGFEREDFRNLELPPTYFVIITEVPITFFPRYQFLLLFSGFYIIFTGVLLCFKFETSF
jgi:hypothetical protein